MKSLLAIAAFATAAATLALPAEAKRYRTYGSGLDTYVEKPAQDAPRSARYESHDDVRAQSADPTGQYAGLPNWARAALGRSSRR